MKTSVASFIVYAVFNLLALFLYPGGTSFDKDVKGYLFCENFFSDLGMVRTYGGQPNRYAVVFAIYTIILGAYLGLMLLGPDMGTEEGLKILATGQKTVIYLGMICWFVQFLGAYKHHKRHSQWHQQGQAV